MDTLENAQRRAEYWKAEHMAANSEIEQRDAAWFSLVMNAAAEIEDAANCLQDSEAKRVAHNAAKHYRDAANALCVGAVPNDQIHGRR